MAFFTIIIISIFCGCIGIVYAIAKNHKINKLPLNDDKLITISGYISEGAQAFLKREYTVLIPFALLVGLFLFLGNTGSLRLQSLSFLFGAFCSALTGYIGMHTATKANAKTTWAAQNGLNSALNASFTGGSVMGMMVVGIALMGISVLLSLFTKVFGGCGESLYLVLQDKVFPLLTGFGFGVSSISLFARVGGGIFTKAADVGADLVGKVEVGIPEDDPRNPAVIADNVGDNVGDVAGMGADLFESYSGAIIGCIILGISTGPNEETMIILSILPLLLAGLGIIASIIGCQFVRVKENTSPQSALNKGSFVAAFLSAALTFPVLYLLFGSQPIYDKVGWLHLSFTVVVGILSGSLIGMITEYYTGTDGKPVREIVSSCITGPATTIISGIGVGMLSTFLPVITISGALIASYFIADFYGIGIAALGMLMTLGIQLSVDAFGPIADNAGGLAVMAELPPSVRKVTDQLDAVGNTTAAIGKGFAVGSAALTAIILISAFIKTVGLDVVDVISPMVIAGMLIGGTIPFLFSALSMQAIGVAAGAMIEEVRRQFREHPGILQNTEKPNYRACVDISTQTALKKMILPGISATISPIIIGFLGGIEMLVGFLIGATLCGLLLAIFMANAGGAWDNAKKSIEASELGKGSDMHKAAVVGDTVGDPFKDTAGPALNTLIKLMAIIALVIAPLLKNYGGN